MIEEKLRLGVREIGRYVKGAIWVRGGENDMESIRLSWAYGTLDYRVLFEKWL